MAFRSESLQNLEHHQNLIICFSSHNQDFQKILWKSIHIFLSYFAKNKQTDSSWFSWFYWTVDSFFFFLQKRPINFNRRVLFRAPYHRCTIWSLQLLPCWNRTFDYFLLKRTHMIAKLFSEPCQHKSCIHKLKQHPCFLPLSVVLPISAVFVLQIEQTCECLYCRFYSSLCCSVSPPRAPSPNSYIYFVWFIKPYSPHVRHSRPGVSWGCLLLKICVLCLDSFKQQHPLHPELTPHLICLSLQSWPSSTHTCRAYTDTWLQLDVDRKAIAVLASLFTSIRSLFFNSDQNWILILKWYSLHLSTDPYISSWPDASCSCVWVYAVIWCNRQAIATHHVWHCCPKPAAIPYSISRRI